MDKRQLSLLPKSVLNLNLETLYLSEIVDRTEKLDIIQNSDTIRNFIKKNMALNKK